jgi:hypothetical protein
MTVVFGRGRGAHTKGTVVKLNDKKAKVQTLEARGVAGSGTVWGVPYSMMQPCEYIAPEPPPYPNGLTITGVRYLTRRECEDAGWADTMGPYDAAVAITLSDRSVIYASRDYEGNGPGALFGKMCTGEQFTLSPAQKEARV